jgi:MFS family permease
MELNLLTIFQILVGLLLLLVGRRLFWLFVGLIGFIVAAQIAVDMLVGQPQWVVLLIAVAVGLVGALIAAFVPALAAAIAGFSAGTYVTWVLLATLGVQPEGWLGWLLAAVGGVLGAVLAVALLDWALIVLSSLAGATAIVQAVNLQPTIDTIVFVVLVAVGIIVQAALMRRPPPARPVDRYEEPRRDF